MLDKNTLAPGSNLLQYSIKKVIGQGGFGITYLAIDDDLKRKVAIKECFPTGFVSREGTTVVPTSAKFEADYKWALDKFLEEAMTLAKFKHPGIVQVLQIIKNHNNTAYMVLEFVDGISFSDWLKRKGGAASEAELSEIIKPLLDALEIVHQNQITHRDIAPDNIYIRENGEAVLLDFGAAKMDLGEQSKSLNLIVKDGYSAPEQYYPEGRRGAWTDIYAMAATIYRAITKEKPIDAMSRLGSINNGDADPLKPISPGLAKTFSTGFINAINQALSPQINARPQTVEQWREMLFDVKDARIDAAPIQAFPINENTVLLQTGDEAEKEVTQHTSSLPEKPNNSFGKYLFGLIALLAIATAGYFGSIKIGQLQDDRAWQEASHMDTVTAYNGYLSNYPDGAFRDEAERSKNALSLPWNQTFGDSSRDSGRAIAAMLDGGMIIAGSTNLPNSKDLQAWVIRLTQSGKMLWEQQYGSSKVEVFSDVVSLKDGSSILGGFSSSTGFGGMDGIVVKYGPKGELVWEKRLGAKGQDSINALALTSSDDLLVAGSTTSTGEGSSDGWIIKLNSHGDVLWEKTFGSLWADKFFDIEERDNGEIAIAGSTKTDEFGKTDFWIVQLSASGDKILERKLGGSGDEKFQAISTMQSGEVLLAGSTKTVGNKSSNAVVTLWTGENKFPPKIFTGQFDDIFADIEALDDGSMVVAGHTMSRGQGSADAWIMKLAADRRDIIWERIVGGAEWDEVSDVVMLEDGGFGVVGTTSSKGAGESDIWVLKFGTDGEARIN